MESEKSPYPTQPQYYPPADGQLPPGQPPYPYPPPNTVGYYPQQYPTGYAQPPYPYPGAPPTAPPQQPQPQPQQQQQQQSVVVIGQQPQVVVQPCAPALNFTGYIIFSCIVLWCCGGLFGLIAFILAIVGQGQVHSDPAGARKLANASLGLSITGAVVGIALIIGLAVGLSVTAANALRDGSGSNTYYCTYYRGGSCYNYRIYGSCNYYYYSSYYYSSDGYCYYNY